MASSPDTETVGGVTFELRPRRRTSTRKGWICLRKNREYTDRYLSLAAEFAGCRMVEVGVDRGGSTAFFTKLLHPEKLVAVELSDEPVEQLTDFLAEHDRQGRVEVNWGVDQADRAVVPRLLDRAFGEVKLDLVVDDASHFLAPSIATFEMIFPRLRTGGLYIIEDWSNDHLLERGLRASLDTDPQGSSVRKFASLTDGAEQPKTPMSVFICQLVIAAGFHPDWIAEIRVQDGFCELRRGAGDIPLDTPLASYTGMLGEWIFEGRLS